MAEAFVSLATNNDYGNGAYVLGKSLKNTKTSKQMVLMVTKGVSVSTRYVCPINGLTKLLILLKSKFA